MCWSRGCREGRWVVQSGSWCRLLWLLHSHPASDNLFPGRTVHAPSRVVATAVWALDFRQDLIIPPSLEALLRVVSPGTYCAHEGPGAGILVMAKSLASKTSQGLGCERPYLVLAVPLQVDVAIGEGA